MKCQTFNKSPKHESWGQQQQKILQNSMYEQECSMVFTDSALWASSVVELSCPSVCVSVTLCHLSHVTCNMSPITCKLSHDLFYNFSSSSYLNMIIKKIFQFNFFLIGQSCWASWWRVCYQRGLHHLVFSEVLCQHGMVSCLSM